MDVVKMTCCKQKARDIVSMRCLAGGFSHCQLLDCWSEVVRVMMMSKSYGKLAPSFSFDINRTRKLIGFVRI